MAALWSFAAAAKVTEGSKTQWRPETRTKACLSFFLSLAGVDVVRPSSLSTLSTPTGTNRTPKSSSSRRIFSLSPLPLSSSSWSSSLSGTPLSPPPPPPHSLFPEAPPPPLEVFPRHSKHRVGRAVSCLGGAPLEELPQQIINEHWHQPPLHRELQRQRLRCHGPVIIIIRRRRRRRR